MSYGTRKILRLRPIHKTEAELEDERNLIFQLPRKKCEEMSPGIKRLLSGSSKTELQHKLHVLKKIMKKARIKHTDDKLKNIVALDASDRVVAEGEVSKRTYNDIFHSRDFDLYGNMMKSFSGHEPRKHLELSALASQLGIEYTQKLDESYKTVELEDEYNANLEMLEGDEQSTLSGFSVTQGRAKKLLTEKWKIGQVEKYNAPVGLSANPTQAYHSLGNEMFYSYDGYWKAGKMHGMGKYLFEDGKTYEGEWEAGKQHGTGAAEYPGGQRYSGSWENGRYGGGRGHAKYLSGTVYEGEYKYGRRQGEGKVTYPSGLTYVGEFFDGKPHGRGRMTSALTGWSYDGTFVNGFICGSGSLITPPPESKQIVYYWGENKEKVTLPSIVRHYLEEQDEEIAAKEAKRHAMYAPLRGAQLSAYVNQIRTALYAERLAQKREAYNENVLKAREQRAKLYEARLKALGGEEDEAASAKSGISGKSGKSGK